jgi:hypothetical protein
MPASLWKSLTARFMALGHSPHEAECIAAVIVIDCLVMYTIMGYRFSDAERERAPAVYSGPEIRSMILSGNCGIFPDSVDRDLILLPCTLDPAVPASRREPDGIPGERRISSAVTGPAATVCW